MSHSVAEVEGKLKRSLAAFVSDVPDHPPVAWSAFVSAPRAPRHHWRRLAGVAASIVLITLATISWASPSAGERYHGRDALRGAPARIVHTRDERSLA